MSSVLGELGGAALNTVGETVAFAGGTSGSHALTPLSTAIGQAAFALAQIRAIDALLSAEIAAESVDSYDNMQSEATFSGYDANRFKLMYGLTLTAPGMGELLVALRRKTIQDDDFTHGLRKAKLDARWDDALRDLQHERISAPDLAYMVVRGLVPDAGLLPVPPPDKGEKVARFPIANIDTLAEFAAAGWDAERARALVGRSGLSMAPGLAAHAEFRGIIGLDDYYLAIAEGDLRNEWRDAILEVSRAILTPHEYQEAALRGLITNKQANDRSAQHGMSTEDADLLFGVLGRPLAVHQITTGLARGGQFGGTYNDVPEPYRDAIRRSAVRPEYARLDYANRYTIPSYFILRAILQDGGMTDADFADYGKQLGWPPALAEKAAAALSGGTKGKGDTHVTKAEAQVWNALHKSYVDSLSTDEETTADLELLGVVPATVPEVLRLWQAERAIVRRSLTPKEIKKAIGEPGKDATWATNRLTALGYSPDDAATFLAE